MSTSKEIPLQYQMFTDDLVDTRSRNQKRQDRLRQKPQQMTMFNTTEMVQLGENARPWLSQMAKPPMVLIQEDPRTPEEVERDLQREAEELTANMFGETTGTSAGEQPTEDTTLTQAAKQRIVIPIYMAEAITPATGTKVEGYRKQLRQAGVRVRRRT